jgi:hypothetical protein
MSFPVTAFPALQKFFQKFVPRDARSTHQRLQSAHRGYLQHSRIVYTTTVKKSYILAVKLDREEHEVIVSFNKKMQIPFVRVPRLAGMKVVSEPHRVRMNMPIRTGKQTARRNQQLVLACSTCENSLFF